MGEFKIYVGFVHDRTKEQDLEQIFKRYGSVDKVELRLDKGFAFVYMNSQTEADNAALDRYELHGREIKVEMSHHEKLKGENTCFHCGKPGHWKSECPELPRKKGDRDRHYDSRGGRGKFDRDSSYRERPGTRDRSDRSDRRVASDLYPGDFRELAILDPLGRRMIDPLRSEYYPPISASYTLLEDRFRDSARREGRYNPYGRPLPVSYSPPRREASPPPTRYIAAVHPLRTDPYYAELPTDVYGRRLAPVEDLLHRGYPPPYPLAYAPPTALVSLAGSAVPRDYGRSHIRRSSGGSSHNGSRY